MGRVFVFECDRCRRGNNTGAVCAGTRVQRRAIIYYVSQTFARRLKHCRYNDIAVVSLDASVLWTAIVRRRATAAVRYSFDEIKKEKKKTQNIKGKQPLGIIVCIQLKV